MPSIIGRTPGSRKRTKKSVSVIYFDGQQYPTSNLSAGSLLFITGISQAGDKQVKILIRAHISRVLPKSDEIALQFLNLDDSTYEILQKIIADRV